MRNEFSSKHAKLESRIDHMDHEIKNLKTMIGDLAKEMSNVTASVNNMNNRLAKLGV